MQFGTTRTRNELIGKNIVVYDMEIKEIIGGRTVDPKTGIEKTVSWSDHDLMGMSVGVLWDYRTMEFKIYMDDNYQELGHRLNTADLIVAFNHIGFDNLLLRANGVDLKPDSELRNFDMLVEGRKAMGWDPSQRFPSGCKLDNFLEATFGAGFMKTSHGEEAPKMWQNKQVGKLVSYCLDDVTREKALFEYIWENGIAFTQAHGVHRFKVHPSTLLPGFTTGSIL